MSNKMDSYVAKILQQHLPDDIKKEDAVWLHKQSGQFIAKHRTLEIIAGRAGIVFDAPVIIESDPVANICIISVTGKLEDRTEWSFGEATPGNYKMSEKMPSYPYAMAEKRAKDRVILKLIGIHGYVYSDQEIDTTDDVRKTKEERIEEANENSSSEPDYYEIAADIETKFENCTTIQELRKMKASQSNNIRWMETADPVSFSAVKTCYELKEKSLKEKVSG